MGRDEDRKPDIIDVTPDNDIALSEELMDDCCRFIATGGTATEWCTNMGINYGEFHLLTSRRGRYKEILSEARVAREEWFKEKILSIMREISDFNPQDAYDSNGNFLGMNELPEATAKMIKKSEVKLQKNYDDEEAPPDEIQKLEYYDKQKAIDQLGKYLNMFIERVEVNTRITLEDTVTKSFDELNKAKSEDEKYKPGDLLSKALQKRPSESD